MAIDKKVPSPEDIKNQPKKFSPEENSPKPIPVFQIKWKFMIMIDGNNLIIWDVIFGTWFLPKISKLDARKKWIIGSVSPKGELIIDDGAIETYEQSKDLMIVKHH